MGFNKEILVTKLGRLVNFKVSSDAASPSETKTPKCTLTFSHKISTKLESRLSETQVFKHALCSPGVGDFVTTRDGSKV